MLKKLLLIIACIFSVSGCSISTKKISATTSTEPQVASLSPLVQAVDLIEKNNYPEAKKFWMIL